MALPKNFLKSQRFAAKRLTQENSHRFSVNNWLPPTRIGTMESLVLLQRLGQNAVWPSQLCSWSSGEHVLHWEHCHRLNGFSMCCHCCLSWKYGGKGSVHIHRFLRTGSNSTALYQESPSGVKYSCWGFVEEHWESELATFITCSLKCPLYSVQIFIPCSSPP